MTDKMEMSLDDIIKQHKANRGGGSGRSARAGSRKPTRGPSRRSPVRDERKPGGSVRRGRSRGGISRSSGSSFGRSLPSPGNEREAFFGGSARRTYGSSSSFSTTKLVVSNLHFDVSVSEILELFSEFGPIKSAAVHYDRSGRSRGSAHLIFERQADAIKAVKQYNGVPLDGREMNIQLATPMIAGVNPVPISARLGSNFKPRGTMNRNRVPSGAARDKNRGAPKRPGNNKPASGRQAKNPSPAAEELDAELEAYILEGHQQKRSQF